MAKYNFKQITDKSEVHYDDNVYDLTVKDVHNYNIQNIIVHNSGGGSLVCYALDIIKIDPIKYDLLFERFLNPERAHIPDIDADFGIYEGYKVFDYLNEKYGKNQCCNIITFMRLKCKSLITDMCRTFKIPIADTKAFTKKIDDNATVEDVLNDKNLAYFFDKFPLFKQYFSKYGAKLENLPRNTGQHAAGICVAPFDVRKITPVVPAKENESDLQTNLSSFEKDNMEALGIIKYDILKLKTLDIIKGTLDLINQNHNTNFTENDIPLNDMQTWKALQEGKTLGVFQFEKPIGVKTLKKVKPDNIEELAACNSFIRPGTEGINAFVQGKLQGGGHKYGDKRIDEILESTFGAIVFQEQTMKLISVLMNIGFGKADLYRRALEKPNKGKNKEIVEDFSKNCVRIASQNGFDPLIAEKVKQAIIDNSGYLFNKCIAGSETIYCEDNNNSLTIEEIYKNKVSNLQIYRNALSKDEHNRLISNTIKDIVYMGVKDVYEVITESNHKIKITDNHKLPTPKGDFLLSELGVGDELYVMTVPKCGELCDVSKIKSITRLQPEKVYHVQMNDPYHNLLLQGGIVVNNSHAVAYSIISYQTAYLKEHYPLEFYATNINTCGEAEFFTYLQQVKQLGLDVLRPDINISKNQCTVYNDKISIGFNVLKGIGDTMAQKLIQHQPYESVQSIVTNDVFNKKCIETLINAGALCNLPLTNTCDIKLSVPQLHKLMEYYNIASGKIQNYAVDSRILPGSFLKQDGIVVDNNIVIMPEQELIKLNLNPDDYTKTTKQGKGRFAPMRPRTASIGLFGNNTKLDLYNIYKHHKQDIDDSKESVTDAYLREMSIYNFAFSEHPCMQVQSAIRKYNGTVLFEEIPENAMCGFVGIVVDDISMKIVKNKYVIYSFVINTPYENIKISMWKDVYDALLVKPQRGCKCKVLGIKSYDSINVKSANKIVVKED